MNMNVYQAAYHDTCVAEFHRAFEHPISYDPKTVPSMEQRKLRVRMLAEELVELARAFGVTFTVDSIWADDEADCVTVGEIEGAAYDPIEAADALGDLRYVVDGGNLICGFPGELVLAEIHRSNMSKLGADGQPVRRADGKTLKGPNYSKPDIRRVLGL